MRHASITTTLDLYGHLYPGDLPPSSAATSTAPLGVSRSSPGAAAYAIADRAHLVSMNRGRGRRAVSHAAHEPTSIGQRNDLNAARISSENSSGSSHAAKCPPFSASLK